MRADELLQELLNWHQKALKIAQNPGDVLTANASLEASLRVLMNRSDRPVFNV